MNRWEQSIHSLSKGNRDGRTGRNGGSHDLDSGRKNEQYSVTLN